MCDVVCPRDGPYFTQVTQEAETHEHGELGGDVATYIMLSKLTDEGRKTLKERPERLQEVNKEVETMGGRITAQYAVLGGYDFVNVIEAPSNEVIARISVELGSRGTIEMTTYPAIAVPAFVEMLRGGAKAGG